jgi:zinc protease
MQALAARYLVQDRTFRMAIIPEGQTLALAAPAGASANAAQTGMSGR